MTSAVLIYFWTNYYHNSSLSPSAEQIATLQTGLTLLATVSLGMFRQFLFYEKLTKYNIIYKQQMN